MPMEPRTNQPEVWKKGQQVVANYNFPGSSKEDLPFKKGDLITIINNTKDVNWYKGKNESGQEGMVPATYLQKRKEVQLHAMPWYHGSITREQAEDLLQFKEDGVFLLRDSVHFRGDFTLSVVYYNKVEHYRVILRQNKLEIDGGDCQFQTLIDLVEHYTKDADGLCTRLLQPLQKKGSSFSAVSVQDFESGGWVISQKDLQVYELIGKGEFGDVYKGTYRNQGVAIKELKDKERAGQAFLKEASVMTSMRHPNLVQLIGVVIGDTIQLVTEFMGKGNLVEYLRSRGRSVITKKDQIDFTDDICSAMQYLESKDLVHRDLAARNILVNDNNTAKVSDFGLAKYGDYSAEGGKFPIKWTAPEALRDNKFTNKSDMWSFGILLWEVYSFGRVPYPRIPLSDVVMHVERGYRMEAPDGCPQEIYNIMMQAWEIDPKQRPTFKQVLEKLNNLRATTV
ncbi:tyrosine-protein kinase CSK-like isoform X1 [Mytilus galloprovincialis]|uniref:tyrosine-protein kinase CSK-like isoform X1 n=1 Tax=Mytilus edulis TaxID=6550 RepID=UPI0039F119D6